VVQARIAGGSGYLAPRLPRWWSIMKRRPRLLHAGQLQPVDDVTGVLLLLHLLVDNHWRKLRWHSPSRPPPDPRIVDVGGHLLLVGQYVLEGIQGRPHSVFGLDGFRVIRAPWSTR